MTNLFYFLLVIAIKAPGSMKSSHNRGRRGSLQNPSDRGAKISHVALRYVDPVMPRLDKFGLMAGSAEML